MCSGSTVKLSMSTWASPLNTYQWNDVNGPISGATSSTYIATVSGAYSLTVTTPVGCGATSSSLAVNIINVSVPSGLSTSVQLDRATMNWLAVTDAHHYDIRFKEQGSLSWTLALNGLQGTSRLKTGVIPSTTYEWEIRSACSIDSSSVSAWSSTQVFTTLTPCAAPLNATTTGITPNASTLTWDAVGGAWGYRLRYKRTNQPWSAWAYDTVTTNSYPLSGLLQATAYHWQVATMCESTGINNSGFTSYAKFITGSCNLSLGTSLTNVVCYGNSDGSIDLSVSGGSCLLYTSPSPRDQRGSRMPAYA